MEKVSANITLAEATKSQTATRQNINNTPNKEQLQAMQHVAVNIFEPIRAHFKTPIALTSFFRSFALNKAIGGSTNSQHCKGEAMDIDGDVFGGVTNMQIFNHIKDNMDFDQLIFEFGNEKNPDWVHVSLVNGLNRRQILKAVKSGGKTIYKPYR